MIAICTAKSGWNWFARFLISDDIVAIDKPYGIATQGDCSPFSKSFKESFSEQMVSSCFPSFFSLTIVQYRDYFWHNVLQKQKKCNTVYSLHFIYIQRNMVSISDGPGVRASVDSLLPRMAAMLERDSALYQIHRLDKNTTGVMLFAKYVTVFFQVAFLIPTRQIIINNNNNNNLFL